MRPSIVYTGPSLPRKIAEEILPSADVRPPIRRGDLPKAMGETPHLIAIIDGELYKTPTVSPKEILRALDMGIIVIGAAGVGALRATELEQYGMGGIGTIFQWFKNEQLFEDDAVMVKYNQCTCERLSDPLVNMIFGFSRAVRDGIITPNDERILLAIARKIYFLDRTYSRVFQEAEVSVPRERLSALSDYLSLHECDLQRRDAVCLLQSVPWYLHNLPDRSRCLPIHGI
jgi:hypothetical protein